MVFLYIAGKNPAKKAKPPEKIQGNVFGALTNDQCSKNISLFFWGGGGSSQTFFKFSVIWVPLWFVCCMQSTTRRAANKKKKSGLKRNLKRKRHKFINLIILGRWFKVQYSRKISLQNQHRRKIKFIFPLLNRKEQETSRHAFFWDIKFDPSRRGGNLPFYMVTNRARVNGKRTGEVQWFR